MHLMHSFWVVASLLIVSVSHGQVLSFKDRRLNASYSEVQKLPLTEQTAKYWTDRKVTFLVLGSEEWRQRLVEIPERMMADLNFRTLTERFDRDGGGIEIGGQALIILFKPYSSETVRGQVVKAGFGFNGSIFEAAIDGADEYTKGVMQTVSIPIDQGDNDQPTPSLDGILGLVKAASASRHFAQDSVWRFNASHPVREFQNLTEPQYVESVLYLAGLLENRDRTNGFSWAGYNYFIFGSGYPTNPNFSSGVDIAHDVSSVDFYNNLELLYPMIFHSHILPENECSATSAAEHHQMQAAWVQQVRQWRAENGGELPNRRSIKLSCDMR